MEKSDCCQNNINGISSDIKLTVNGTLVWFLHIYNLYTGVYNKIHTLIRIIVHSEQPNSATKWWVNNMFGISMSYVWLFYYVLRIDIFST